MRNIRDNLMVYGKTKQNANLICVCVVIDVIVTCMSDSLITRNMPAAQFSLPKDYPS